MRVGHIFLDFGFIILDSIVIIAVVDVDCYHYHYFVADSVSLLFSGGLRLGSDFDTDSEMEPGVFGNSKKSAPEEDKDDFDFYD